MLSYVDAVVTMPVVVIVIVAVAVNCCSWSSSCRCCCCRHVVGCGGSVLFRSYTGLDGHCVVLEEVDHQSLYDFRWSTLVV